MNGHFICIGHSHVEALERGAALTGIEVDAINMLGMMNAWERDGTSVRLRPDIAERVGRARLVLSGNGGEAYNVMGTFEHPRPFDFVLPADPNLPVDDSREILPAEAVRAKMADIMATHLEMLPALLAAANGPVLQLEPPPPMSDRAWYPTDCAGMLVTHTIAPKWLRYKLWRLHGELVREACAKLGIVCIAPPAAALDSEGFLTDDFARDAIHGNAAYGALVLETVKKAA